MSRFFHAREIARPGDGSPHLAKREIHWKKGSSACELAHSWVNAGGIPSRVRTIWLQYSCVAIRPWTSRPWRLSGDVSRMKTRFGPQLVALASLSALIFVGFVPEPSLAASPPAAKPLPEFVLPQVREPGRDFRSEEVTGAPALINVWASWCPPCLAELPLLISVTDEVRIYGINYKDKRADAVKWLEVNGNAYIKSGHDPEGEVARRFGVYGVPETFVIDRNGRIVHRHTGPISAKEWAHTLRPLIQRLENAPD